MATDFSIYLHKFLASYLANERGAQLNTIDTYRYTFIAFAKYLKASSIKIDFFEIKDFNRMLIVDFLDDIEKRGGSIATRNNRLAAIISFCKFLTYEYPEYLDQYLEIMKIPFKKTSMKTVPYLEIEDMQLLMSFTSKETKKQYRDYMILLLLYETGARVSELINFKPRDFHMQKPYYVKILGKGNKERVVPLAKEVITELQAYLHITGLDKKPSDTFLFTNSQGDMLTRAGITYVLNKYADLASENDSCKLPKKLHPHIFRHTKAMHLLQGGVNIVYIRDFLGHTSIQTTEIYARANSKLKQEAIENAFIDIYPVEKAEWENESVLVWLKNFS